jgi:hypothetical protein
VSYEAVCVLNTGMTDAHLTLTIYFDDRDPITGIAVTVGAERTRHIRLDHPEEIGGVELPRGVAYAIRVASDVPVTIQHSRLDTSQEAPTLITTIAHPAG